MEQELTMMEMVANYARELEEEQKEIDIRASFYWSEEDMLRHAYRKRDWHKNKGKRRIKDGYKERYV